jgi:hypothetical protein
MAEYVLRDEDKQEEVAKMLLEHAGDRKGEIEWRPRPDRNHGGVFYVPDDLADGLESSQLNRLDDGPSEEEQERQRQERERTEQDGQDQAASEPRTSRAAERRAARAKAENKE